ncbi:hypothetical protein ACRAKI_15460 [Saccharothrix isguenensis]
MGEHAVVQPGRAAVDGAHRTQLGQRVAVQVYGHRPGGQQLAVVAVAVQVGESARPRMTSISPAWSCGHAQHTSIDADTSRLRACWCPMNKPSSSQSCSEFVSGTEV